MATEGSAKKEMPFLAHLEELRWRLVRAAILVLVFAVVAFIFVEDLMDHVLLALSHKEFITYRIFNDLVTALGASDGSYAKDIEINFQSITVTGQFGTHIYMSIVAGVILTFPFIFYQIWSFIKPGLKESELRYARGIVVYGSLLFILGVLFGYYLVSPLCVQFFGNYKMHALIENNFTISSYLSTITSATFASGLFFELPVVIYILSKIGIVSPELLRKYRKHALVGILVLSAIITPPDIISQVLVSIPILILYEIGILISKAVQRRKAD